MKSLLKMISESADKKKKKFTVTVTDADGNEVQKTAMAFNIGDIKAYWPKARPEETFVNAELHDDEVSTNDPDEDTDKDMLADLDDSETPSDTASEMPSDDLDMDDELDLDSEEEDKKTKKSKTDDEVKESLKTSQYRWNIGRN